MAVNKLVILQHNVSASWKKNKCLYLNSYSPHDPDILLLNETGVKESDNPKIFNYRLYHTNDEDHKNDGSIIAIKKSIRHKFLKKDEGNILVIQVETRSGPINIATLYLPPRRRFLPRQEVVRAVNRHEPSYIIGDFNACHRDLGSNSSNPVGTSLVTLMNRGILRHLGPPFKTYHGLHSSTPDKIFSNTKTYHNLLIEKTDPCFNDHVPIKITISCNPIAIAIPPRLNTFKTDWEKFSEETENFEYKDLSHANHDEINTALADVTSKLKDAISNSTPLKSYRVLPHARLPHAVKLVQTQYRALLDDIEENGAPLEGELRRRMTAMRRELQRLLKQHNDKLWSDLLRDINVDDPRSFWGSINKLMGNDNKTVNHITSRNGAKLESKEDIAEEFRSILAEVFNGQDPPGHAFDDNFKLEVEGFLTTNRERITSNLRADPSNFDAEVLREISTVELRQTISKMKNKAPGCSSIRQIHLKHASEPIIEQYRSIFNACLTSGYFPSAFKSASILMIPKPSKCPTISTNYRPISLLEVPGKVFEKIFIRRVSAFWDRNGYSNPNQFGFRPSRGTGHAIALACEKIAVNKTVKSKTSVVLRDVQKAFDKVWLDGLKYKILQTNLPRCMEKLLCNYMDDRTAFINFRDHKTNRFPLNSGVAQGGCASPALYIFYNHDIPETADPITNADICFADDVTQLVCTYGNSHRRHKLHIEREINRINTFERKWRISTSVPKFKVIPLSNRKQWEFPLIINGQNQDYSESGSFLGLKLTSNGYSSHFTQRAAIAHQQLTKLFRFRQLGADIKRRLYLTLVRPLLEYPAVPLHLGAKSSILKLQRVQNRATHFITNTYYPDIMSSEALHARSKLIPINQLLHKRAGDIWRKIEGMNYDFQTRLDQQMRGEFQKRFPSSMLKALGPQPAPIFK